MSSVVSIYFPGADSLPYVASLIGESNGAQTLAISCGPGVNTDTCGLPSSVTVTAGPSTAFVSVSNQEATFVYDCKISGSTTATCAETFNGNAAYIQTSAGASTMTTSTVTTELLASSDLTWMPITITAGLSATATSGATATTSASDYAWSNAAWSDVASSTSSTGTQSTTTASTTDSTSSWASWGSSSTTNTSSTQTTGTSSSGNASWSGWSNTAGWSGVSSYTGAAGKVAGVGSVAAGLLAVAAMLF